MNKDNILSFSSSLKQKSPSFTQVLSIAEVTHISDTNPASIVVTVNEQHYQVAGCISLMAGITPSVALGDKVLISEVEAGILIHGVVILNDEPARASFGFIDDKLVIEAQGAVVLKSGNTTVELTEAGGIRIDGKDIRTTAENSLTLLASKVKIN